MGIFHGDAFSGWLGVVCKQSDRRSGAEAEEYRRAAATVVAAELVNFDGAVIWATRWAVALGPNRLCLKKNIFYFDSFVYFIHEKTIWTFLS